MKITLNIVHTNVHSIRIKKGWDGYMDLDNAIKVLEDYASNIMHVGPVSDAIIVVLEEVKKGKKEGGPCLKYQ